MTKNNKVSVRLEALIAIMVNTRAGIKHYTEDMHKEAYWQNVIKALKQLEQDVFSWYPLLKRHYFNDEEK